MELDNAARVRKSASRNLTVIGVATAAHEDTWVNVRAQLGATKILADRYDQKRIR